MKLAYDPIRVRSLARSTVGAIDHLATIRSHEPAAGSAIGAVRDAGRHLERDWMPLLSDIVHSTAMTEWWQRHHAGGRVATLWFPAGRLPFDRRPNRYEVLSDDELLRLVHLDGLAHGTGPGWSAPDFTDPFWAGLPELAAELARRSARPEFAAQLVADIQLLPLVAMSVPLADFPIGLVTDLAGGLLSGEPIRSGVTHTLHPYAVDTVLRQLVAVDAGATLDLLANPSALLTLASWDRLDQQLVRDVVRVGLYDSVAAGVRTVEDGVAVIATLVELANGPLDRGMGAGAARGVADSMFGYVHTIAHGIHALDSGAIVVATDAHGDAGRHLGTVADMRDLFGALLRDAEASATLATVLGAYTAETVERLGPDIGLTTAADDPVKFALLLDAARREEQFEIDIAAQADAARNQQLVKTIGFGLGLGLGALGVPSLVGNVAKEVVSRRTTAPQRPSSTLGRRLGATTHEGVRLSVLGDAADHPERRAGYGLSQVTDTEWDDLRTFLAAVDRAGNDVERVDAWHDLTNHIERNLPAVSALMVELKKLPGMDHLHNGGVDVDPD